MKNPTLKTWKKVIETFLAISLVIVTCVYAKDALLHATEEGEQEEVVSVEPEVTVVEEVIEEVPVVETVVETPVEETTPVIENVETTETVEETIDETVVEEVTETTDETVVAEVEEVTEEIEETIETEEVEETVIAMPAAHFTGYVYSGNGVNVTVDAPEGAFPEGTTMKLSAVSKSQAMNYLEATLGQGETAVDAVAVDITFFDKDGKEIEPKKAITVNMSVTSALKGDDFKIAHVSDSNRVDVVTENASASGASFSASDFSVYVIGATSPEEEQEVETETITVTIRHVTSKGLTLANSYATEIAKGQDGKYSISYTVPQFEGKTAKLADDTNSVFSFDGTILSGSFEASKDSNFLVEIVYESKTVNYKVEHSYEQLDGTYEVNTAETQVIEGEVGYITETTPKSVMGFTPVDIDEQEILEDGSTVVTVKYARNTFNVIYNTNGGSYIKSLTGKYGEEVTVYAGTEGSEGHLGLTCGKAEHVHVSSCYNWRGKLTCKETEHSHNDSCYSTVGQTNPTWENAPTKQGYVFGGWYSDAACTQPASKTITLTQDVTVYAKWNANTASYTVVYQKENIDGSYSFISSKQLSGTVGQEVSADNGASFTNSAYYSFEKGASATIAPNGSTVVYGNYKLKEYTITFDLNKTNATLSINGKTYGKSDYSIKVKLGQNIADLWPTAENIPNVGSDKFYTWTVSNQAYATKNTVVTTQILGNGSTASLTAKGAWLSSLSKQYVQYWIEKPDGSGYEVSREYSQYVNLSNGLSAKDLNGLTRLGTQSSPTKPSSGGYPDTTQNNATITTTSGEKYTGTVYNFYYNRNTYDIVYTNGSSTSTKSSIKFGADISGSSYNFVPAIPSDVDPESTFGGWFDNPACEGENAYTFTTMPSSNLALYAKWNAPTKTVTLVYNNGESENSITVKKGDYVDIDTPTYAGYFFDGWYTTAGEEVDINAPITKDMTIVARWIKQETTTYTVYYKVGDTDIFAPESHTGKVGKLVKQEAKVPTGDYAGYIVNSASQTLTLDADATKNVIVFEYSKFENAPYRVFYVDGSTIVAGADTWFEADKNVIIVRADIKQIPVGYELDDTSTKTFTVSSNADNNHVDFKVKPIVYTITYQNVDSSWASSQKSTYKISDADIYIPQPTKEGYSFEGWTFGPSNVSDKGVNIRQEVNDHSELTTVIETGSHANLILTAKWSKIEAEGLTVKYDGRPHTIDTSKINISGNETYTLAYSTSKEGPYEATVPTFTDAGTYTVYVQATKVKEGKTITLNTSATVTIEKRTVTLTSASDTKEFDGTALTNSTVNVTGDGFATGEGATYEVTGSQTLVGSSGNTFTYTLNGNPDNYTISSKEGTLTVTTRKETYKIEVEANSATAKYDGESHKAEGLKTTTFTFNGQTYTVSGLTAKVEQTNAGTYTVNVEGTAKVTDAAGNDVTDQFTVTTKAGSLVINKREVTLTSADDTKEYDGKPLTNDTVTVTGDGFVAGEGATYEVTGSQTLVGSSGNTFTYTLNGNPDNYTVSTKEGTLTVTDRTDKYAIEIEANSATAKYDGESHKAEGLKTTTFTFNGQTYTVSGLTAKVEQTNAGTYPVNIEGTAMVKDTAGNNVTDQFTVTAKAGTLVIEKRTLTLTSATDSKEYDGTPLTNDTVIVTGDGFVAGEGATYEVTGSQTLVGSSGNTFTYDLNEGTNAENYTISTKEGTLTVEDRKQAYVIEVEANSDTAKYDGQPHLAEGFKTTTFTFNGQTYTVSGLTAKVEQTNAGTYPVNVTGNATVTDASGNDVTSQFTVTTKTGTLVIEKRTVTLTSATDSKEYDGTALTNDTVTVTGDGFATGEGATYDVTGSQTLVGSSGNTFTYTLNGNPDNYTISTKEGTLTVTTRKETYKIEVEANSATAKYDGESHKAEGLKTTTFTFNGQTYTVTGLTAKTEETNSGTYTVNVEGTAKVTDAAGNDVTDQFTVTTKAGSLVINKRTVTLTSASDTKEYDGKPLTNDTVSVTGDGFVEGEGATYNVTGSQTLVGSKENTFSYTLITGTNADNYTITTSVGTLTVTNRNAQYKVTIEGNSLTTTYDGTEKSVSGIKNNQFEFNDVTYTVTGFEASAKATDAGTYPVNVVGKATVTDENGNDVTAQFSVETKAGSLVINKREVTLTSADDTKEYDGTPLINNTVNVTGDGFATGEGATYDVTGSQTLVGSSENTFTYTLNGNPDNYTISTKAGTLTVEDRKEAYTIEVEANSATAKYDGEPHKAEGLKETTFEVDGQTYTVTGLTAKTEETNAGTYTVSVEGTAKVTDVQGNDVTDQFTVTTKAGSLVINKRTVTLTSADDTKEYDGTPLTNNTVNVTGDGFATGEGATYDVTGSQTLVGSSENTFTYNLNGNPDNYTISTKVGTLTVEDRKEAYTIEVEANSDTAKYDGETHKVEGLKETTFEVDGQTYTVEGLQAEAHAKDAGTYTVAILGTAKVVDAAGNDVTAQFKVTKKPGTLEIEKRTVVLTSADDTKEYDGTPLVNDTVTVTEDGFIIGEGATYEVTGSQTLVGSSGNTFTYTLNEGTARTNYNITTKAGTLTVTDRTDKYSIEVEANSATAKYDGESHKAEGLKETTFEIAGQTYTVTGLTANVEKTNAGTYTVSVEGSASVKDAAGNDVSGQFTVTKKSGTLEIEKRTVVLTSATDTKQYDGTALTNNTVTDEEDGFAVGEGATYAVTGSQTLVGSSDNTFTYTLNEGTESTNYNITTSLGTLTVTDRTDKYTIEVEVNSATAIYDGTSHSAEGFKTLVFTHNNQIYSVTGLSARAEATNVSKVDVVAEGEAKVIDINGNDVTSQFTVTTKSGTLEITARPLSIKAKSDSKEFDGTPLTNAGYEIVSGSLAENQREEVEISGEITLVGTTTASIDNVDIKDAEGNSVKSNYDLSVENGTLEITSRKQPYEITVETLSDEVLYDGASHSVEGFKALTFSVNNKTYTVSGLTASVEQTNAGTYPVSITGEAKVEDENGNDVTNQFKVTPTAHDLVINKRELTLTSATDSKKYDGTALTNSTVTVTGDGFAENEGATYDVTGSQKLVGFNTNEFTYELNEGTNADNYIIHVEKGQLTVTSRDAKYSITMEANSGTVTYDGTKQSVEGFKETEFTIENNTYTVSGLTVKAEGTDADTYSTTVSGTAVVKDAEGNDVSDEFEVTVTPGSLVIEKIEITVSAKSDSKQYDGLPLTAQNVGYELSGTLAANQTETVVLSGSRTLTGEADAVVESVTIKDAAGNDVTTNYDISTENGLLTIETRSAKYQITLTTNEDSVMYDGTSHKVEGFVETVFTFNNIEYTVSGLTASVEQTNAGTYPVSISGTMKVTDPSGNDVTSEFTANYVTKDLVISKRSVTMTSADDTKEYDGTPLTNDTVTVTGDGFVEGEGATYSFTGSQTIVGSTSNTFTYELQENTNKDNYDIAVVAGALSVTNRNAKYELVITGNSGTTKYNGMTQQVSGYTVTKKQGLMAQFFGLEPESLPMDVNNTVTINGAEFTIEGINAVGQGKDAGTYSVVPEGSAVVKDANGNDVTAQFSIETKAGSLVINKREVTLTSASLVKKYDREPLVNGDEAVVVGVDGFVTGEELVTYEFTGTQTEVGTSENSFNYTLDESVNKDNYNIQTVFGNLTVTEGEWYTLTIHYQDKNGKEMAADYVGEYLEGDTFSIASPAVKGYTPNLKAIRSGEDGMPAQDLEFTVVYNKTAEEIIVPDDDPEDEPVIVVPPNNPETPDEPEKIGEIVEVEDDEFKLVEMNDEEETPLVGEPTTHKCCILHFLIMLVALIVEMNMTSKRKKNQEHIHELKRKLGKM